MIKNFLVRSSLIIMMFLTSCKKESLPSVDCNNPTDDISTIKLIINGKWTWAYEKVPNRASQSTIIKTPQTEGLTRNLEFYKNGDVRILENSNLSSVRTYEITTLNIVTGSDFDKDDVILLFKDKLSGQRTDFAPIKICNDTIKLYYDLYSHTKGEEVWSRD